MREAISSRDRMRAAFSSLDNTSSISKAFSCSLIEARASAFACASFAVFWAVSSAAALARRRGIATPTKAIRPDSIANGRKGRPGTTPSTAISSAATKSAFG